MSEIISDPQEVAHAQQEAVVAQVIGETLAKHYPKRNWHVEADIPGGVAMIYLPEVSEKWSMVVHINTATVLELQRKVVRFGGEFLERFKLSRDRKGFDDMYDLKRNRLTGEVLGAAKGELQT